MNKHLKWLKKHTPHLFKKHRWDLIYKTATRKRAKKYGR